LPLSKSKLLIALAVIVIVAVALGGNFLFFRKPATTIDSIAVLPFQNVSNDPNVEYLSDGISESLIDSSTARAMWKLLEAVCDRANVA